MKQQDIAMLVLIVSISLVVSFFVGNAIFGGEKNRSAEVEQVEAISDAFPQPSEEVFNEKSINLTQKINIGDTNTENPFSSDN